MTTTTAAHSDDTLMSDRDETVAAIAQFVSDRRMTTPALLFLTAHRPLAFAAGQLLVALEPLAGLLDISACAKVAKLLSEPHSVQQLHAAISAADLRPASTSTRHV